MTIHFSDLTRMLSVTLIKNAALAPELFQEETMKAMGIAAWNDMTEDHIAWYADHLYAIALEDLESILDDYLPGYSLNYYQTMERFLTDRDYHKATLEFYTATLKYIFDWVLG